MVHGWYVDGTWIVRESTGIANLGKAEVEKATAGQNEYKKGNYGAVHPPNPDSQKASYYF